MRIKTLGVLMITVLAAFTMLFWFTDGARREAIAKAQEEELLHFGEIIFSEDATEPAAAGCARCHGADGTGGEIPNDPSGRRAPSLRTASLGNKLSVNPEYIRLAVSYGGVVVSGSVNSPMPAWSAEVGGPLNEQQLEAVVAVVTKWALEAAAEAPAEIEDTPEAGADVFASAGCAGCHGGDLTGSGAGPDISAIGSGLVDLTGFPEPSQRDLMQADFDEDPRIFLENWIRDSANNYNDGEPTQMPPHSEDDLSESALRALITFLLTQTGE